MNLKGRLKVHLQSQKHVAKEVQKKKENEKDKQHLSRNQLASDRLGERRGWRPCGQGKGRVEAFVLCPE